MPHRATVNDQVTQPARPSPRNAIEAADLIDAPVNVPKTCLHRRLYWQTGVWAIYTPLVHLQFFILIVYSLDDSNIGCLFSDGQACSCIGQQPDELGELMADSMHGEIISSYLTNPQGVPTPRIVTEALDVIRRELILDSSYTPATRMTGGQSGVDQFSDTYQFCTYFPDYTLRSKLDCEQIPRNASRLL
ncbi:hypothetical protein KCU73_g8467, partial [Aureobasidium melanogenum]